MMRWRDLESKRGQLNALLSFVICLCMSRWLTLPDASSVDVHLDVVGGMQGLMIVQDEHVAAQRVHTRGVHQGILGNQSTGY